MLQFEMTQHVDGTLTVNHVTTNGAASVPDIQKLLAGLEDRLTDKVTRRFAEVVGTLTNAIIASGMRVDTDLKTMAFELDSLQKLVEQGATDEVLAAFASLKDKADQIGRAPASPPNPRS